MTDKKKDYRGGYLLKGKIPEMVFNRIESGVEKTTAQWAKTFGMAENRMRNVFLKLRKSGRPIYPIGTRLGKGGNQGVMKLITQNLDDSVEATHTYRDHRALPALKNVFKLYEQVMESYPELAENIESDVTQLLMKVMEGKENIKRLK